LGALGGIWSNPNARRVITPKAIKIFCCSKLKL